MLDIMYILFIRSLRYSGPGIAIGAFRAGVPDHNSSVPAATLRWMLSSPVGTACPGCWENAFFQSCAPLRPLVSWGGAYLTRPILIPFWDALEEAFRRRVYSARRLFLYLKNSLACKGVDIHMYVMFYSSLPNSAPNSFSTCLKASLVLSSCSCEMVTSWEDLFWLCS